MRNRPREDILPDFLDFFITRDFKSTGLFAWSEVGRPIHRDDLAVALAFQSGSVDTQKFAAPPEPLGALLGRRTEPILPEDGADLMGRLVREGIGGEESENMRTILKNTQLGAWGERNV